MRSADQVVLGPVITERSPSAPKELTLSGEASISAGAAFLRGARTGFLGAAGSSSPLIGAGVAAFAFAFTGFFSSSATTSCPARPAGRS